MCTQMHRYPQSNKCETAYLSDGVKFKLSTPTLIQTQNSQFHELFVPQFSRDRLSTERMRNVERLHDNENSTNALILDFP